VAPIHGHRDLGEAPNAERGFGGVPGEHLKAQLAQDLARDARATVPRRREDRLHEPGQRRLELLSPGAYVVPLHGALAGAAELALAPASLVVRVRESVLVEPEAGLGCCAPERELLCEPQRERARDDREVDRQLPALHDPEQRVQPLVVPSCVVVAQEEVHRGRRLVQRRTQRREQAAVSPPVRPAAPGLWLFAVDRSITRLLRERHGRAFEAHLQGQREVERSRHSFSACLLWTAMKKGLRW
jgi:hypothetical protein